MKGKIVVEESLTEYLQYIQNSLHETKEQELRKQARLLVGEYDNPTSGYIAPRMSTDFNPNLYLSGQEEEFWIVNSNENVSTIQIIYTGMRLHDNYPDDARVWLEFSENLEPYPPYRELERDYAYYQETGSDPIAKPSDAKHKFAIKKGVFASRNELHNHAAKYLKSIMRRGNGEFSQTTLL